MQWRGVGLARGPCSQWAQPQWQFLFRVSAPGLLDLSVVGAPAREFWRVLHLINPAISVFLEKPLPSANPKWAVRKLLPQKHRMELSFESLTYCFNEVQIKFMKQSRIRFHASMLELLSRHYLSVSLLSLSLPRRGPRLYPRLHL